MLKRAIAKCVAREDLTRSEMVDVFEALFRGEATPAQMGALLVALRMKGETPDEVAGAAEVMRRSATRIETPAGRVVIDTCGTGGDGAHTFNISTAAAIVVAAAGVCVAKHGNRSVSSQSGSADVLRAAGVGIEAPVALVERCLREVNIGFLFAPRLHGAMKHVAAARSELGVRSIFNLLGPLANPAGARRQLMGVYADSVVMLAARTLATVGTDRALVVHGREGLDEISPSGPTHAAMVEGDSVREFTIEPGDAGLEPVRFEDLRGGDSAANAATMKALFSRDETGVTTAIHHAVVLNAGAALWVAGVANDLREGVNAAREVVADGRASACLEKLIALTQEPSP